MATLNDTEVRALLSKKYINRLGIRPR